MREASARTSGGRPLPAFSRSLSPRLIALAAWALVALGVPAPVAAQGIEGEIESVSGRLEAARSARLQLIAPRNFDRAAERLADAQARYERGGRIEDIRRSLTEAGGALAEAERLEEVGSVLLRGALDARADALEANAPEFAARLWEEAEALIREAGRSVESGDQNGARERSGRAESRYREAELASIRADVLGRARELRASGMQARANERAPGTFARADSLFRQAELILQGDRYQISDARGYAESAADGYRNAARIAATVDSVGTRSLQVEDIILRDEALLADVADTLNFEASFLEGSRPVTDQILAAIASLYEDRANLQQELAARAVEIAELERQVDGQEARLAELEEREATVTAELRERERRERTLREVRAIFSPDEAEVLLAGDELRVRMYGLTFASGSSEISPQNFSLLTKLQRVLREFPNSRITVEGHTDSQGNDDFNQALSERRAQAVREYLLANMALAAERVSAVGLGETRPIATNDTADGRAKNRRIEVSLAVSGG